MWLYILILGSHEQSQHHCNNNGEEIAEEALMARVQAVNSSGGLCLC